MTSPARFALASLATWRVTHLLAEEDGPAECRRSSARAAGHGQLGELMDCFYCLSIWVAAPFSLTVARRRRDAPLVWLALSGARLSARACDRGRARGRFRSGRADTTVDGRGSGSGPVVGGGRLGSNGAAFPAAEPGDAARRARRRSRARARLREPGLSPRRERPHPPAVQRQALDRVPPRVPGLAAAAVAPAGTVHGALLPRRGHRVRRRASPVRALPPRRLRPLRRALARASLRRVRGGRDRPAAPRRAGGSPLEKASAARRRRSTPCRTARSCCTTTSRGSFSAAASCAGRPRATRGRGRDRSAAGRA